MTDLEKFKELLRKANASFDVLTRPDPDCELDDQEIADGDWLVKSSDGAAAEVVGLMEWEPPVAAATIIRVEHGTRCHYEAAFGADGSIIETGQFEEM